MTSASLPPGSQDGNWNWVSASQARPGDIAPETYPATITRPPATVSGHRVLAWAELRHLDGNYPGGIVLAVSDRGEFVTWTAYTKDGGQTWHASGGFYTRDHSQAWASFTDRCRNLATTF